MRVTARSRTAIRIVSLLLILDIDSTRSVPECVPTRSMGTRGRTTYRPLTPDNCPYPFPIENSTVLSATFVL